MKKINTCKEDLLMDADMSSITICGRTPQEFLNAIENFHGWKAPGIVLGGFMVDWARELIGPDIEADAIVETTHCLPDAVQLFTPCTFGNGPRTAMRRLSGRGIL